MIKPRPLIATAAALITGMLACAAPALGATGPGALDPSFGNGGIVALPSGAQAYGVAEEPGGQIVAAGSQNGHVFAELIGPTGSVINSYSGPAGVAQAVAVAPDGDVILAGQSDGAILVQALDSGLSSVAWSRSVFPGQSSFANAVALTPGGAVVVGGQAGGATAVAELSASGAQEWTQTGFENSVNGSQVNGVALAPNGDIVAVGQTSSLRETGAVVAQLSASGAVLDDTVIGYPGAGYTILTSAATEPDGEVVAAGLDDQPLAIFVRITEQGGIDSSFGAPPASGSPSLAALASGANVQEPDFPFGPYGVGIGGGGRVLGAGDFEDTGAGSDQALYALTPSGQPEGGLVGGEGTSSVEGGAVVGPDGAAEACAMTVDRSSGDVVTAGDDVAAFPVANPCGLDHASASSASQGFVSRLVGFGAPPEPSGPPTPPPPSGSAPSVSTGPAIRVSATGAELSGLINPDGLATGYRFQYGAGAGYGSQTALLRTGAGSSAIPVLVSIGGLRPDTTYHYRLLAENSDGGAYGAPRTFRTPAAPALHLTLGRLPSRYTVQGVRGNRLILTVACSRFCRFYGSIVIGAATARRMRLGPRPIEIAGLSGSMRRAQRVLVHVRLTPRGKRILLGHADVLATLRVNAISGALRASAAAILHLHRA
jgi:hypothetical protein